MKVLVLGSGAIGLRTALEVLRRQHQVVLRSAFGPLDPRGCSQGAGGLWMPFRCDDPRVDRWALETLDELLHEKDNSLVECLPTVYLRGKQATNNNNNDDDDDDVKFDTDLPLWTQDARLKFQQVPASDLDSYNLKIPKSEHLVDDDYSHAWLFHPPIVNSPRMLQHMLSQVVAAAAAAKEAITQDVQVETGEFVKSIPQLQEMAQTLGCDAVINCAGLGAADLCRNNDDNDKDDDDLEGARGILLHYDRANCVRSSRVSGDRDALFLVDEEPWGSETLPCYTITRGDIVVVGGSYLPGDTEESIRPAERERLLANARLLGIDTDQSQPIGEWTGFRPKRSTVRCEVDTATLGDSVRVVHNYGHGGSGWTVNVGAARECVDLLLSE